MNKQELNSWYELIIAIKAGIKLDRNDYMELLRLNQLVMEESHLIHNDNMINN